MSETAIPNLNSVTVSLLITLYIRAMESQRPDALIKDKKAEALVRQLSYDFSRIKLLHLSVVNKLVIILRCRQFDCYTRDFLASLSNAVVVHIGCGLDTRFERVYNGQVEWYDLDLPEVIEQRRRWIDGEKDRYHLLGCSVLEDSWLDFDVYSPIHVLRSNLQTARFGLRAHWGIWHGQELETWENGIRLLDEWGYFDTNEPRLAPIRWLRPIEKLARTFRIYHFRLGEPAG